MARSQSTEVLRKTACFQPLVFALFASTSLLTRSGLGLKLLLARMTWDREATDLGRGVRACAARKSKATPPPRNGEQAGAVGTGTRRGRCGVDIKQVSQKKAIFAGGIGLITL